jgi:hypothetical protein
MMPIVTFIAFVGFFCSLAVHIASFGQESVAAKFPMVFSLHVGAMITAAILLIGNTDLRAKTKQESQRLINQAFARMPFYAKAILIGLTAYTVVNFFFYLSTTQTQKNNPSQASAHEPSNSVLRGFSGHWMFFYLAPAMLAMYRRPRRMV